MIRAKGEERRDNETGGKRRSKGGVKDIRSIYYH